MAKDKGRRIKRKAPAPLTDPTEPTTCEPVCNDYGAVAQGTEKESGKTKHLSGFIFMCNQSTKLECYQYRVFGLPSGKKEVVEAIKPGAKLFLFDFESKLLYGIYEATSAGNLNLEPAAFRGRFPAQVKFKIFKECLPLPENSLRHIIKENYEGHKFKQELSRNQVKKLSSSFLPLVNVSLPRAMPASATGHQFMRPGRLPAMEVPYLAQIHYSHIPQVVQPRHVPIVNPNGHHRASSYVEHVNPTPDSQCLMPASSYYVANSQRSSFTEGVARGVQEPSYSSYRAIEERPHHDQATSFEKRYLTAEESASHDQVTNLERRYLTEDKRAPHNQVTNFERQFYQLPSQYQENVAAYNPSAPALYTPSVSQPPQAHAPYYPPQGGSQCQDNVVAYNTNPAAPLSHYTPASGPPTYPDGAAAFDVRSTSTHPQVGIAQANAPPVSYYYST